MIAKPGEPSRRTPVWAAAAFEMNRSIPGHGPFLVSSVHTIPARASLSPDNRTGVPLARIPRPRAAA